MKSIFLKVALLFLIIFELNAQSETGLNLKFMDTQVRPQDDFYNYTNGSWMNEAEIPADRTRWGSFDQLREKTDLVSLGILQNNLDRSKVKNPEFLKVIDLYTSFIDWKSRNKLGIKPLNKALSEIDKIKNLQDLQNYLITQTPYGGNSFFPFYIRAHMKKSNENAVYFGGPDLGMGRDYYQKSDEKSMKALSDYGVYLNNISRYAKLKLNTSVPEVVNFEKIIADFLKKNEERRDSKKNFNPVALQDLSTLVQNIDLQQIFSTYKIETDTVIIPEINYFKNLDNIINTNNLPIIKDYLKITLLNNASDNLDETLDNLNFQFYSATLRGQKEQRSIEKRGLEVVNQNLGEILGKLYVAEVFPPAAKENAQMMVGYLIQSFAMHIENLAWMSPETKVKAFEKLTKFSVKIGYPDKWKDFSKLELKSREKGGTYYDNGKRITYWRFFDNLSDFGQPVDKSRWGMSPQTVNAYYNPSNNEIVFPAAILQPPFYDYKADMALNFGGIGAVIGHEISHGFDDSGSQYDGLGNLVNWWTDEDAKKFKEASDALAEQYNQYEPLPGVFVNGKFTLGENIADLGGVSVAYDALQMYLKDFVNPGLIDNFTQEQRFFLSWATIWRTKYREEALINQIKTDPHSPGYFRAIGPLVNQKTFFESFKVREGDKMYKSNPIIIW